MKLTPDQQRLADYMSDISEDCYCASWLMGLEYFLWGIVLRAETISWGQSDITEAEIAELKRLSELVGGWIIWVHGAPTVDECPTFVPMQEWLVMFAKYQLEGPAPE